MVENEQDSSRLVLTVNHRDVRSSIIIEIRDDKRAQERRQVRRTWGYFVSESLVPNPVAI
ncbi:MAG TPA: hypothetical protein PLG73_16035 [Candidatus Sumerlaeota bacterium]|nr:hypothetical protein [Candidatus Sumerlaeota bacterium]